MGRSHAAIAVLSVAAIALTIGASTGSAKPNPRLQNATRYTQMGLGPPTQPMQPSHRLTECPQAGLSDRDPAPLDRRQKDAVEVISDQGDDVRVNQDYSCFPQNETSVDVNPVVPRNVVGGQNDYRLSWGTSGFGASTTSALTWHDSLTAFPTPGNPILSPVLLSDDHIDGGGDPAIVFDRAGLVYYAQIHFERERDDNGIFVNRSTNGGFTWSRPCVPIDSNPPNPTDNMAVCGGNGDPRQPGDGVVVFEKDPDGTGPAPSAAFHDKEYIAAGPRPVNVGATCFTVETKMPVPAGQPGCPNEIIGVDRLYVTWTRFDSAIVTKAEIFISYSDDQGRSWSQPTEIPGAVSTLCLGGLCDSNQFSVPTAHPKTGHLYVAYENFNTPNENQYLVSRSTDGGQTFQGPFFVTPVFDINYPDAGGDRPDCTSRGQQSGRDVLTNSCFRVISGGNVVVDKRGDVHPTLNQANNSQFADDLYLVLSDNRNGTRESTNTDVLLFKSTDGGTTWVGPTRANNDPSTQPADRDCSPGDVGCAGPFGNDQWFPWVDIGTKGELNAAFHDRRLDTTSPVGVGEWPTSKTQKGNYLAWFFGAQCQVTTTGPVTLPSGRQCVAANAVVQVHPGLGASDPGPAPQLAASKSPFRNFQISDVPSNLDYSFRAGIFMGDYNNVAVEDGKAYGFWTDARNGRSSRNQPGRNPACEQADVFIDSYSALNASTNPLGNVNQTPFLVTECPKTAIDPRGGDDDVDHDGKDHNGDGDDDD